jgi:S-sulfosulfanyl-L-cysteine sulfohydrolase
MIKSLRFVLISLGAFVWLTGCDSGPAKISNPDIRILWTNDTHGFLSPNYHREEGDDSYVERAPKEGKLGGMAHIATLVKRQRTEMPDKSLLVDAGDTWHGTIVPLRLNGRPVLEVMNAIGYDAMTPGNVEFIYSQEILTQLIADAKFPILAANFYSTEFFEERVKLKNLHPYIVKKVGDLKIGLIGMTYHWNIRTVAPANVKNWSFGLRMEEVKNDIAHLRDKEKVDLVVMLSHMGWPVDEKFASLVGGIDVIVGAHTHDVLYKPSLVYNEKSQRDVLIVQSGSQGKMLGQLDLKVKDKRVAAYEQTLFPVRSKDIEPDPKIAKMIEDYRAPYKQELERVIGRTETLLYRLANWQNTGDNLITDAVRSRFKTDVSVSASWRFGGNTIPGPITVEDVYNLIPSEAPVHLMKIKGQDLWDVVEESVNNVQATDPFEQVGGDMLRYSGMEVKVDLKKSYPDRVQSIHVGGKPLDKTKIYSVAGMNSAVNNDERAFGKIVTSKPVPLEVIAYIEEKKVVAPKLDNRITDPEGRILADNIDIQQYWTESGRKEFDLNKNKVFRYIGKLKDNSRFATKRLD